MDETRRPDIAGQLAEAEARCAARGGRLTSLRRRVFELLLRRGGPVKAYDVQDALRIPGRRMAPTTIYRALDFLIDHGLAHRVDTLNAYVACTDRHEAHQPILLVCSLCEKSVEISDADACGLTDAALAGFLARTDSIEIKGACRQCAANAQTGTP
jgi:Fur family zinc uptake transcriptional regulator